MLLAQQGGATDLEVKVGGLTGRGKAWQAAMDGRIVGYDSDGLGAWLCGNDKNLNRNDEQ